MSPSTKKIIAYAMMLIGSLVSAFFSRYKGSAFPFEATVMYLGFVLFFGGIFLYLHAKRQKPEGGTMENVKRISLLFHAGEKVTVDLQQCRIISASSIKEPTDHDDAALMLAGRSVKILDHITDDDPPVGTRLHQCVLVFEHEWKGKTQKFISPAIAKDRTTLEFLLAGQKHTTLYIDKTDPANYHFDLLFLG